MFTIYGDGLLPLSTHDRTLFSSVPLSLPLFSLLLVTGGFVKRNTANLIPV